MKEEGRRKKEEGGFDLWIGIPTQNGKALGTVGVLTRTSFLVSIYTDTIW
jgi:hypothetical protein